MIFGVTVDHEGKPLTRMIVNRKLAVGLAPGDDKNYPTRLDHFVSTVRSTNPNDKGRFVVDEVFTDKLNKTYGSPLLEVDIILLSNDIEEVFRSEFAWRRPDRSNAMLCHGDGHDAIRQWMAFTKQEQAAIGGVRRDQDWVEITSCGDQPGKPVCPHLANGDCGPSGDLYFYHPEEAIFGSVATLHTGGWEAVKRLASSLAKIQSEIEPYGGQLKGLRLKLVARTYRTHYRDKKGIDVTGSQLAFNLEFRTKDYQRLIPGMVAESKQLAASMEDVIDVEPIDDVTIATEFNPTPDQQAAQSAAETGPIVNVLDRVVSQHKSTAVKVETTAPVPVAPVVTAAKTAASVATQADEDEL